jgi:glycosyltransferase involved in cell wall biosynthesis
MICMVSRLAPPDHSGIGAQAALLARELRARGENVCLVSARPRWRPLPNGDELHRRVGAPVGGAAFRSVTFGLAGALWLLARRRCVRIVHLHGGNVGVLMVGFVAQLMGVPTLYKVSRLGDDDPHSVRRRRLHRMRSRVIRRSHVVAISPAIREACVAGGIPGSSILEIPNGVDLTRFRPACLTEKAMLRAALGLPPDALVTCFVGTIERRKRVNELLHTWSTLPDRGRLVLVGPVVDAPSGTPVDGVHLVGEQDRPEDFLRASDIFVFMSAEEGLPNALLEAGACGLPSIVHRLVGITDHIVRDGQTGYLVEAERPGEFLAAFSRLRDRDVRRRMGTAARAEVVARFSIGAVAERYLTAYGALR